jgi:HSP20 family protein
VSGSWLSLHVIELCFFSRIWSIYFVDHIAHEAFQSIPRFNLEAMASHKIGHKLFYLANCMPAFKRQAASATGKGTDAAAVCEASGRSWKNSSHSCHKPRMMASAAQELSAEETGRELVHQRGGGRGFLFRGKRHSPFDLFDSFFPNRNLRFMIDRMDKVFDDPFFARSWMVPGGRSAAARRSPWDFVETDDSFRMRLDLPGLSKEEVKLYVEDGSLVIKAEHSEDSKADEAQWGSSSHANYSTRILLPDNANSEMIKAELKNGVLNVTVPKVAVEEPKKNVIDVQVE